MSFLWTGMAGFLLFHFREAWKLLQKQPAKKRIKKGFVKLHTVHTPTSLSTVARRQRWASGFTLAEVIIAVFVLGILITSLYAAFSFGFAVVKANQESIRADQILVEQMENLRYYNWDKITNGFV